jgi:hypothetical protein
MGGSHSVTMIAEDGVEVKIFINKGRMIRKIPRKVTHVNIHPSVKRIRDRAFINRRKPMTAIIG